MDKELTLTPKHNLRITLYYIIREKNDSGLSLEIFTMRKQLIT